LDADEERLMTSPLTFDAPLCLAVVEAALARLTQFYVFPDVAAAMERAVRRRIEQGAYDTITTGEALQATLTADLRRVNDDRHLRLVYHAAAQPARDNVYTDPAWLADYWRAAALDNYGVYKVERLPGNVGLLDLRAIDEAEYTAEAIAAALAVLSNTSALILDLRSNNGGESSGVAFLCSYFVPANPVHLNDVYSRPDNRTQQYWTSAYLPGKRYLEKPVFVLTSSRTFSGAEEIAYNLQALKRATIVGETTFGGAHPVDVYQIHPHFDIRVPVARSINPITGTNWEGTGVKPDIPAAKEEALRVAYREALRQIIDQGSEETTEPIVNLVAEARDALQALETE
jgi:C-terminal processing protease CtpA/Prc